MGIPAVNRALELFILAAALGGAACASDGATGTSNASGVTPNTRAPAGSVTCGTAKAIFTRSPVALTDFFGWVPLGNMGPPAHTFPTDHQYIYVNDPTILDPVRSLLTRTVGVEKVLETYTKLNATSIEFKVLETMTAGPIVINRRIDRFVSPRSFTWEGVGVFFVKDGKIKEWNDYTITMKA